MTQGEVNAVQRLFANTVSKSTTAVYVAVLYDDGTIRIATNGDLVARAHLLRRLTERFKDIKK